MTLTGTPDKATDGRTADAKFTITLLDPCDPPQVTLAAEPDDQVYTLTDLAHPDVTVQFSVQPDYCPVTYSVVATQLDDGSSAVSHVDNIVSIEYTKDLLPLGQFQVVTVVATSRSKFGGSSAPATGVATFNVTFKNPCFDTRFVEIVPPAVVLDNYTHVVLSESPQAETHPEFTVTVKTDDDHTLCGAIRYSTTFGGEAVGPTDLPFAYTASEQKIVIETGDPSDSDLIG